MKALPSLASLSLLCASQCLYAQSSNVTIYGRIDTSIESIKSGNSTVTGLNNNASRLGFRGIEDLGGDLKAYFGLELSVGSDDGTVSSIPFRNSYVGLGGRYGTFNVGRLDAGTPTHLPLYALVTRHTEFVAHDAGSTAVGNSILNIRTRVSNAAVYKSPVFYNTVLRVGHFLNGNSLKVGPDEALKAEDDYKQTDVSLSYGESGGPLGVGIGYGQDKRSGGHLANDFRHKWIVTASYEIGPVRAWIILNRDYYEATDTSRSKVDVRYVGASWDVTESGKLVANLMTRDVQSDRDGELRRGQAGYVHRLSKRTAVYALLDLSDPNDNATGDMVRALGGGIVHNF